MIGLEIPGEGYLDLMPDASIRMKKVSPLFGGTLFQGSYSFPFDIPATDHNKVLLGFPEDISRKEILSKEIEMRLWVDGSIDSVGLLQFRDPITPTRYTVSLHTELGYLAKRMGDKALRDMELGGERVNWDAFRWVDYQITSASDPPSGTASLTLNSTTYTAEIDGSIEAGIYDLAAKINADRANGKAHAVVRIERAANLTKQYYIKVRHTFPGTRYTFSYSAGNTGNIIVSQISNHTPTQAPALYFRDWMDDAIDATTPDYDWVFYPVLNPDFYAEGFTDSWEDYVNKWSDSSATFFLTQASAGSVARVATPFIRVPYLLEQLFIENGFQVTGDFLDDDEIYDLTVYSNKCLNRLYNNVESANAFYLREVMPDLTQKQFLAAILSTFGQAPVPNGNAGYTIVKKSAVLQSQEEEDWTPYTDARYEMDPEQPTGFTFVYEWPNDPAIGERVRSIEDKNIRDTVANEAALPTTGNMPEDVRFVTSLREWWEPVLHITLTDSWQFYSLPLHDYVLGDGEERVPIKAPPGVMYEEDTAGTLTPNTYAWTTPYAREQGVSQSEPTMGYTECGLKLYFYRGKRDNKANTETYPFATYDNYDAEGLKVGDYSLRLDGEYDEDGTGGLGKH